MLCAIYKSNKKSGMFLYVEKRDQFDDVPEALLNAFGTPQFFMLFNLAGDKSLALAENHQVQLEIEEKGFYLQMPLHEENLLEKYKKTGY